MSTPLIYAARLGSVDAAVLLLRHRCDASRADMRGMTALMYASAQGFGALVQILVQADPTSATLQDCNGWTALHWAVRLVLLCS
jgi:ankyrin repeat protein